MDKEAQEELAALRLLVQQAQERIKALEAELAQIKGSWSGNVSVVKAPNTKV